MELPENMWRCGGKKWTKKIVVSLEAFPGFQMKSYVVGVRCVYYTPILNDQFHYI